MSNRLTETAGRILCEIVDTRGEYVNYPIWKQREEIFDNPHTIQSKRLFNTARRQLAAMGKVALVEHPGKEFTMTTTLFSVIPPTEFMQGTPSDPPQNSLPLTVSMQGTPHEIYDPSQNLWGVVGGDVPLFERCKNVDKVINNRLRISQQRELIQEGWLDTFPNETPLSPGDVNKILALCENSSFKSVMVISETAIEIEQKPLPKNPHNAALSGIRTHIIKKLTPRTPRTKQVLLTQPVETEFDMEALRKASNEEYERSRKDPKLSWMY